MKSKSPATPGYVGIIDMPRVEPNAATQLLGMELAAVVRLGETPMAPTAPGSSMRNTEAPAVLLTWRSRAINWLRRKSRYCCVKEAHGLPKIRHRVVDVLHGIIQG